MSIHLSHDFTVPRHFMEKSLHLGRGLIPMGVSMVLHGFLTFKDYIKSTDEFVVGFPNEEMRKSFVREYISAEKTSLDDFLEN